MFSASLPDCGHCSTASTCLKRAKGTASFLVALHLAKHIVPEPERLLIKIKLHASETIISNIWTPLSLSTHNHNWEESPMRKVVLALATAATVGATAIAAPAPG
jgi:hypothetical protein